MTALPKIPKSAFAVLNRAGIHELEDLTAWCANVADLRGFGPKAFEAVEAAMAAAGLSFAESSDKDPDVVNRAMAEERMQGVPPDPVEPSDLPNIGRPARRALASISVRNLADLTDYTEADLLALHGFGPKALRLLKDAGAIFRS